MTTSKSPYQELESRFERLSKIGEATGILQWDMATNMPMGGTEARAGQLSALKVLRHEILTDPALADFLDAAEADRSLDPWQQANLAQMRRRRARAHRRVPSTVGVRSDRRVRPDRRAARRARGPARSPASRHSGTDGPRLAPSSQGPADVVRRGAAVRP